MDNFYLGVALLMNHDQMSHNQAKKWVLSFIYRAAVDLKKSKKKLKPHNELISQSGDAPEASNKYPFKIDEIPAISRGC